MKKLLIAFALTFAFISCGQKEKKISLWEFFPNSKLVYDGGFENTNYTVTSEKIGDDLLLQKIEGSAMTLTKVLKITSEEVKVVFVGEEGSEYQPGITNRDEIIIKAPLSAGNSWKSNDSTFTIESFNGKLLVISRSFDESSSKTVYEIGVGMISDSFSSGEFKADSKLVEKSQL